MTSKKRYCLYCGNEIISTRKGKKFCCSQCGVRWHNEHKPKPIHEVKNCVICGKEFTAYNKNQVTCGGKDCKKIHLKNKQIEGKKNGTIKYKYKKDEGMENPKPKALSSLTSPASKRWASMSWKELTIELDYYGLTYKQSQLMAEKNTLPEDFGIKRKKGKQCQK